MRGAGGTPGGEGRFFIGIVMMCGGFYMLLNAMIVNAGFGFGRTLYHFGGFGVTSGMIFIPFLFGIGFLFYNSKNYLGWLLSGGAIVALIFGVLSNMEISFRRMSVFDLIVILVLCFGGIGLFLSSFRPASQQ